MELELTAGHPIFEPFISAVSLKGAVFLFAVRSSHSRHGHRGPPSAISLSSHGAVTDARTVNRHVTVEFHEVHEPGARRALVNSSETESRAESSREPRGGVRCSVRERGSRAVMRRVLSAVTHSRAQALTQHSHHNHARHTEASLL